MSAPIQLIAPSRRRRRSFWNGTARPILALIAATGLVLIGLAEFLNWSMG